MGSIGREYRPRGYQLEMLEQSLAQNIIAVMDTGSGKTQIAILRIQEELERCSQDKLVWFLAPTVALCTQQHEVMLSQLPAARTKLLLGADNVDRWSDERIWDAALSGVHIVVSTHAVLLDALANGFVQMTRLALLVFDEAHHCRKKHPANRIMEEFYHPRKLRSGPDSVPRILGLTASPIVKSKSNELDALERNLDATCRSPRVQRGEMLKFVNRPVLKTVMYESINLTAGPLQSAALSLLNRIGRGVTAHWDDLTAPDPLSLGICLPAGGYEEQLVKFKRRADHIYEELGPWAADYFILESIKALRESIHARYEYLLGFAHAEKTWLLEVLGQIPSLMLNTTTDAEDDILVSPKAERLILFLANQDAERCSGLVFVQQRATVSVLNALLSRHPRTKDKFRCTTFVGLSNSNRKRYSMAELLDLKAQREALTELRAKVKNLIIATDVLEEGIDVTACNLVVCFDVPSNLKSFLQRRGRARQEQSTFAILLDSNAENHDKLALWQQLEEDMIRLYQDETRLAQTGLVEDNEAEENVPFVISVPATGAKLTVDMTMSRLHHFCQKLPPQPYADLKPAFETTQDPRTGLFTAAVTLPNCISASVRQANGCYAWHTERAARKDAAFQAYQALFDAGLLNNHLLPLTDERALAEDQVNRLPALVEVHARFDPWIEQATAWASPDLHRTDIILLAQGTDSSDATPVFEFSLTTPSKIPFIDEIKMYCTQHMNFIVRLGDQKKIGSLSPEALSDLRKTTNLLRRAVHSDRLPDTGNDFVALFAPKLKNADVATWLSSNQGRRPALEHFKTQRACCGFVRTPSLFGQPFGFWKWHVREISPQESMVEVECTPLPKRRHFLRQETLSTGSPTDAESQKTQRFPAKEATVDALPVVPALFGLFIPGVLQYLEVYLVAQKLCTTILRSVPVTDLGLVVTALSCSSAEWVTNYQRLEYVGDSVLKFMVSWQLFLDHPGFHEGYLSHLRAKLTSNNTLARAALRTGLDAFIIAEVVHMGPDSYPRISTLGVGPPASQRRSLSSKVLADVVEALIGAAYVDGGFELAVACINTFLPDLRPAEPMSGVEAKRPAAGATDLTNFVVKAEDIIRYRFRDKGLLLEALTHPTCERDVHTESYQRLEFLGDAVLDMLVVSHLAKLNVTPGEMTRIKAAIVNGALLGFFCLELSTDEDVFDIEEDKLPSGKGTRAFRPKERRERRHLWAHMRFHGSEIAPARDRSLERHRGLREAIRHSLEKGARYPWRELTLLKPEKFLSDIIESTIGAIFVDSQGELEPCQRFLERIGIWDYLRRVCAERVDTEHPKPALARLAGAASVRYDTEFERHGPAGEKLYRCTVTVDEEVLAEVRVYASKDEAATIAAEMARRELLGRRSGAAHATG